MVVGGGLVQSLKCVVGELVAAVSQRVDSDSMRDLGVRPKVPDLFVMKWHSAPAGCKKLDLLAEAFF